MDEIIKKINELSSESQKMKLFNDRRFSDLENRHSKANNSVLEKFVDLEKKIDKTVLSSARPFSANLDLQNAEYKTAFQEYVRKGNESSVLQNFTTNQGFISSEQGYLITSSMMNHASEELENISLMRKLCTVTEISTEAMEVIKDGSNHFVGWSAERKGDYQESDALMSKKLIHVHEMYAQPRFTQRILDDPRIDIEKWLSNKLTSIFAKLENQAFISGDGIGKPQGILSAPKTGEGSVQRINSGNRDGLTVNGIINLVESLPPEYLQNASLIVSHSAIKYIRSLQDGSGRYIWEPRLDSKSPDKLLGIPVYSTSDMPAIARDKEPIVIGDFKSAYQIVDRFGIRVLRDPFTNKPYIKFYSTKKVGGAIINHDAVRILHITS